MKKASLLCVALLAVTASVASAQGLNLAWNNCYGEGAPVSNKVFACASNSGTNLAVASFIPATTLPTVNGNEVVFDLQSAGSTLPAWWQFKNAGSCRQASLTVNFVANAGNLACVDEFSGAGAGGIGAYTVSASNPNRARLTVAIAVPASSITPVVAGTEYFAMNLLISNAKTVGTGSCAGCSTPVCLVLNSIKLTQPVGVGDVLIGNPAGNNAITWQGGAIDGGGCPAAVPTRNTTWGAVKSLYR